MSKHFPKNNKKKPLNPLPTPKKDSGETQYRQAILGFLAISPDSYYTAKDILDATDLYYVTSVQKLKSILQKLALTGRVIQQGKGLYRLGEVKDELVGKLEVTRGGYGFVVPEVGDHVFVSGRNLGNAMSGDTVKVRLLDSYSREGLFQGEVIEVVQRHRNEFVGTLQREPNGLFFVIPESNNFSMDFVVRKQYLNGATSGDKVYVRIFDWDKRNPEAEVVEVLGKAGEHQTEMHAILMHYGFNPKFPEEVQHFADAIPEAITQEEIAKRRDFRNVTTFTIDPIDAKDFDDALSFRHLDNGNVEVGVHIADVSHYLLPGTVLDVEAFKRATSVYLVDRTVPMLPERLSNFLCSLRPHEEKLTYSAVFELDSEANIIQEWFGRTIIHSDHRFTYEGAQEVLEGVAEGPYEEELTILNALAKKMKSRRMKKGSVDFDTEEVKFELDKDDKPIRLYIKQRKDAHKLIEEFMLLANQQVATFVAKMFDNPPLTYVYRIHDRPDPEKLADLSSFIEHFGYEMKLAESKDPAKALSALMAKIEGRPEQAVIERVAIRSMAKAVYSTKNIGHFGLGFQFYSHFTSPIRRYPDVMAHRLLTQYLDKHYSVNSQRLEIECDHCSKMEKTAAEAERSSVKFKQVEFMAEQIGKEFMGVISGVRESGFYVEMTETLCEGMVPLWTMTDDHYLYDEKALTLSGRHSGKVFRMGDVVRVRVTKTDIQKRQIDLEVVSEGDKPQALRPQSSFKSKTSRGFTNKRKK